MNTTTSEITLEMIRESIYTAAIADAMDKVGYRHQSPNLPFLPMTGVNKIAGRCKTTLWTDFSYDDPKTYDLELKAIDSSKPDDVIICAAGGSMRSGLWGEMLSTAARNAGCVGTIVNGAIRDISQTERIGYPVFALGSSVYDSMNRQKVIDFDVSIEIDHVIVHPGDLVVADRDGIVFIPSQIEDEVLQLAWEKINDENKVLDEIRKGMKASESWKRYGIL